MSLLTEKQEGNFVQVGLADCHLIGFIYETKKKSNNKAYSKVPGALISKFLCSADISNPFSWGEDKESIPPNVTKAG